MSFAGHQQSLKEAVDTAKPLYILPRDSVTREVLIPALRVSTSLDMMMGYFSSNSFSEIAPGLATFLKNSHASMRMVISPYLVPSDFDALTKDEASMNKLAQDMFIDGVPKENAIAVHTLECLAWLILEKRLVIKVAVMRSGIFHPKVWLFQDAKNRVAIHGSTNLTQGGLANNLEQLTLSRDWKGDEQNFHVEKFRGEFDELWTGGDDDCHVFSLSDAIKNNIVERYKGDAIPDECILSSLWKKAEEVAEPQMPYSAKTELTIPNGLIYESGVFAHQGEAVNAWIAAGHKGILEMATGAGKTIASMICATRLQNESDGLLVVVSAPYRPLIEQWCDEIGEFGVRPVNLSRLREQEVRQAVRKIDMGISKVEILVASNVILCKNDFIQSLSSCKAKKLLIADECHNLGSESFITNPPEIFDYRLGLSATPIRQYDEVGSDALVAYFGAICFSFTLEQAIGKCLTEYDYHVYLVELSPKEMQAWEELSDEISRLSWKFKSDKADDDAYLQELLRARRLVLETASGKIARLSQLIDEQNIKDKKYILIYATDKDPLQLDEVNRLLDDKSILYHQLTQEETKNVCKMKKILADFQGGGLRILTAKRVLDEGVNIPQIMHAFILASTTVERQWVQRRGRLLRKCKEIGKEHAVIHDFVVVPPGMNDASSAKELDLDAKKMIQSELNRAWEFARSSRNRAASDGAYEIIEHLRSRAYNLD